MTTATGWVTCQESSPSSTTWPSWAWTWWGCCPVYTSPQDGKRYDISDYQDIDPTFGSPANIDALISGLHERGTKLVMDMVVNHPSDEHAWFRGVAGPPA